MTCHRTASLLALAGLNWFFGPTVIAQETHRLASKDAIEIKVYEEPDLDTTASLSSEGKVTLPLVGEVALQGLTTSEAAKAIADRYKKGYLVNPLVTVTVSSQARKRFTVLGSVNKPGSYYFPEGESVDILQAIGLAGGFTRMANPKKVTVTSGDAKGEQKPTEVDAKSLSNSKTARAQLIKPGDVITVPESPW